MEITIVEGSIIGFSTYLQQQPELIICMGDTLTHLASKEEVGQLIGTASKKLADKGKLVFSFRDLTVNLVDEQRFIPVKSDENRILTCFLEYFPDYVNVFDLLYEKQDGKWTQKVSCYPKIRISAAFIESLLTANGFHLLSSEVINRMVYVVAQKT
jgi:hypothetical protein